MSTDISGTVADRQRSRAGRRAATPNAAGQISPPRQRRPALAALALLLIVGGALVAGLLAVRMDSRSPVLVAKRDIEPGARISAEDFGITRVASEGLGLLPEELADQVDGAYATRSIPANTLLDQNMVTTKDPIPDGREIVAVPLESAPERVAAGDLVRVFRTSGGNAGATDAGVIGTAYVLEVSEPSADDLGGAQDVATASLLVLEDAALPVVDAAHSGTARLSILATGQEPDVELEAEGRS